MVAAVPQVISYQGRLTDSENNPVEDGTYQVTFTLWDDPAAMAMENQLWSSGEVSVEVTEGLFHYLLGFAETLPDDVFASDTSRWLGIKVGEDPEISPRTKIVSVPYAYHALRTDTAYAIMLTPSDLPETCETANRGQVYYDSYLNELCYCNGSAWYQVDGGGYCGCEDMDGDTYDVCDAGHPYDTDGLPADCDDDNDQVNPGMSEQCDGLDNDCDGYADDGDPGGGAPCNTGLEGICEDGTLHCQQGQLVCVQNQDASPELCDGLDNDCDGAVDEGNPGGGGSCDTGLPGVCGDGTLNCQDGSLVCDQNQSPSPEVCDGLDNDCDGAVDDGNPEGGGPCDTGLPGICGDGTLNCQGGSLVCNQNQSPSPEVCDGLDNDCDGMVDDGNPGGGGPCSTGSLGVCSEGTEQCQSGAIACVPNNSPSPEVCDGLDNDCDGAVDEGNPGGGSPCDTGLLGVCAEGTTQCQGGSLNCVQNVYPETEICGNGLDDDCDGVIDNGCP
jgi:hypothetical protein